MKVCAHLLLFLPSLAWELPEGFDAQKESRKARVGCTAIGVDHRGTVDASSLAGMNADCSSCDSRLTYIPPRTWLEGEKRPVFANGMGYPRMVTRNRGTLYAPENNEGFPEYHPLAHISLPPATTLGYWESILPLMNEKGLSFGESSCGTLLGGGGGLLDIAELMRISLERCTTSRCAVKLMGSLSEEYGFLPMASEVSPGVQKGERKGYDDAGEAVFVADSAGEVWAFHVAGGVEGITKSVWAAQRLPAGHLAVIANSFTIGDLPLEPNEETGFLFNPRIREACKAAGIWGGEEPFHFSAVVGIDNLTFQTREDKPPIPAYSTLRSWRVFSLAAPSLNLKMTTNLRELPFSVPLEKKVSHRAIMKIFGDYYQGTEFDMSEGILAGPFGAPYRIEGGPSSGQIPRGISIPRTAYSMLGQARLHDPQNSVVWYAPDQPMTSVFVPLHARGSERGLDASFTKGTLWAFDRDSAFWAFDFVSNWMQINWKHMSEKAVFPTQRKLQDEMDQAVYDVSQGEEVDIDQWQSELQKSVVSRWWKLADSLVTSFHDGYYSLPPTRNREPAIGRTIGYPQWYADMIGFNNDMHPLWVQPADLPDPLPPHFVAPRNPMPAIYEPRKCAWDFLESKVKNAEATRGSLSIGWSSKWLCVLSLCSLLAGLLVGRQVTNFTQKSLSAPLLDA